MIMIMLNEKKWEALTIIETLISGENISPGGSALDLSEFPALANRMLDSSGSGAAPSRPSYGVVSKPAEPQPDFSILNEDFPALPGSGFLNKQGTLSILYNDS